MACGCIKKTVETSQKHDPDPVEESYRLAFLRESRKTAELASRLADAEKQMEEMQVQNGSLNRIIGRLTNAPRVS